MEVHVTPETAKKLKDLAKAREVYATVPTSSPHYKDAQKKLQK